SPDNHPQKQRLAMAEFLTRANYGITIGNFEMDFDSGEIHYKTSIDVGEDRLSTALVQQLVYANVTIADRYLPGIMAVIYGKVSPAEAIAQIEG
ncbi:MAG: YbjN domain-containing protein, partial [Waterburya sp.]